MTKQQKANKELVVRMMCATARHNGKDDDLNMMIHFAERLHRLEATLSRLAEAECGDCDGRQIGYDEAKQERIENLAEKLITENLGCKCYTQRDPRGFQIRMYLVDETGRKWFNSWDGETTGLNW